MIRVTCDTCSRPIDRDNGAWIGVDVTDAPEPPHPDPVQAMNDAEADLIRSIPEITINGDHQLHFCDTRCLAVWAVDRSTG